MVARAQWLFGFVKVMFGRNTWLVMGGMVKKVCLRVAWPGWWHVCHR